MAKIHIHKKFKNLITSADRYFVVTGGRGSGKSFSVASILCLMMLEENRRILFLRKTLTSAHLSIIPEFLEKLELYGITDQFEITKTEITNKVTGSSIFFRGIQTSSKDNTANLKSLQGISCVVLDEAEELTDESVFDKIDLSVRQKGIENKVILILNPTTKEHWIYQRFFEQNGVQDGFNGSKNNTTYIHSTYLDNIKNLDESFVKTAEDLKIKNPAKYNHVMIGGWLNKAEGVIYTNWTIGEFDESLVSVYGQDFGFSIDPTTLVQVGIDSKQMKIYLKEHLYKANMSTGDIYSINNQVAGKSLIIADSAEPRLISELQQKGNNIVPTKKGAGSVNEGIKIIQDYELVVDSDSSNIIKELNNYTWLDNKKSTPIDAYNHILDGVRYAVTYTLAPTKGKMKRVKTYG